MKSFLERAFECLDDMIEERCDNFGIINTIQFLLDSGFTEDELVVNFRFDREDVERAMEADEEFDDWGEGENE